MAARYRRRTWAVIHQITGQPAHTIAGVIFKADISDREGNAEPALMESIVRRPRCDGRLTYVSKRSSRAAASPRPSRSRLLSARPAATIAAYAPAGAEAELLDLGRQWQAAWAALHQHDLDYAAIPDDDMPAGRAHEALGDKLFAEEQASIRRRDGFAGTHPPRARRERPGARPSLRRDGARRRPDRGCRSRRLGADNTCGVLLWPWTFSGSRGRWHERDHPAVPDCRAAGAVSRPCALSIKYRRPLTPAWCEHHMPLIDTAMDLLSADDVEFARRCRLMRDDDGRAMLDELAGQIERLGAYVGTVAEALAMTSARNSGRDSSIMHTNDLTHLTITHMLRLYAFGRLKWLA